MNFFSMYFEIFINEIFRDGGLIRREGIKEGVLVCYIKSLD